MGLPVVVVAAGGLPVIVSTNGYGLPCTISTNGYGLPVTQSTNGSGLAVIGVSFGPTIQLSATSVLESAAVNTVVGTLSVSPGTTGTPVFTLVDSAGGKFNISGTSLRTNAALDYETATYHNITVAVSGVTPAVANATFTVFVANVDDTSPIITSSNTVSNAEATVLAHALTANEAVTWMIVGGADQARFELSGSTLRWLSNGVKDFEAPDDVGANNTYVVNVVAVDLALNASAPQVITVTVTDVLGAAPAAPVLDLLTDGTDNTPDFTLTGDLALGDTVRFQYSTSAVFSGASEVTNAIDAGEDAANTISFSTGSLANATWYFRARIERPGTESGISDWSNTETIAISVVSSYTGPADIVTLSAFYGLRAAGSAYTATPAVRLIRSSDSAEADISTLANGSLNTADAFFNGSTYKVVTLYDQLNGAYGDLNPGTAPAGRPTFTLSGLNGLPTIDFSTTTDLVATGSGPGPTSQPVFLGMVAKRGTGTVASQFMVDFNLIQCGWQNAVVDLIQIYAGSNVGVAVSDATFHAVAAVFNGASSTIRADTTTNTGDAGNTAFYNGVNINVSALTPQDVRGTEFWFGLGDATSSLTALTANQIAYWGPF